jgi:hypothetical protein
MNSFRINPISLAQKLAARQVENMAALELFPREHEAMLFVQSLSAQSGAIERLVDEIIECSAESIGTRTMREIGKTDEHYTAAVRQQIIGEFPNPIDLCHPCHPATGSTWNAVRTEHPGCSLIARFDTEMNGQPWGQEQLLRDFEAGRARPNLAFVNKQNYAYFFGYCRDFAKLDLPLRLQALCTRADFEFHDPFYISGLREALIDAMDRYQAREYESLAETAISAPILDSLQFACSAKAAVKILGGSRFGKTKTAECFCRANPGKARFVQTPCSNADRDLMTAIAEAIGIEVTPLSTQREIKLQVEFFTRHCHPMFVFDEAHYLFPRRFGRNTPPMRLDWIRLNLMDRQTPTAFITTPQSFSECQRKFIRATQWNNDQFEGRICRNLQLPESLAKGDVAAVVKVKLPGLAPDLQRRIAGAALMTNSTWSPLAAVERIVRNSLDAARRAGRSEITAADIEQGVSNAGGILTAKSLPCAQARKAPASAGGLTAPALVPAPALVSGRAENPFPDQPRQTVPELAQTE